MTEQLLLPLALVALAALLFGLERLAPLRRPTRPTSKRLGVNLAITGLAFTVSALVVAPAAAWTLGLTEAQQFGLLPWLGLSTVPAAIVGFLGMDLTFYAWHRANHEIPFLWRFHAAHHLDPDLDVSTSFRFHPGEMALSAGFRVLQLGVLGVPGWVVVGYEAVFLGNTLFHHSNVRLPLGLERVLHFVLVTPRMHGIHHSQVREETDANYSVVLPWWDHLLRTIRLDIPQDQVRIGVPAWDGAEGEGLGTGLAAPLRPPDEHWRRPDGERPRRDPGLRTGDRGRITG